MRTNLTNDAVSLPYYQPIQFSQYHVRQSICKIGMLCIRHQYQGGVNRHPSQLILTTLLER